MKSKHLLMALLSGGLTFGSCTSTPHVPEGKYLIAGMLKNCTRQHCYQSI